MIVVSDTSPVSNLYAISQLELLHILYQEIVIPQAVFDELLADPAQQPHIAQIQAYDWIRVLKVTNQQVLSQLLTELDQGEAEALTLAQEIQADLILLDEHRGRQAASRLGLHCTGLLGVLLEAKAKGLIPAARPLLDRMRIENGFWLSDAVYQHFLSLAHEEIQ